MKLQKDMKHDDPHMAFQQKGKIVLKSIMRTENNNEVAPGLYIYYVESENGVEHIGKFAVIR